MKYRANREPRRFRRLIHHPLRRLHVAALDGCEVISVLLCPNSSRFIDTFAFAEALCLLAQQDPLDLLLLNHRTALRNFVHVADRADVISVEVGKRHFGEVEQFVHRFGQAHTLDPEHLKYRIHEPAQQRRLVARRECLEQRLELRCRQRVGQELRVVGRSKPEHLAVGQTHLLRLLDRKIAQPPDTGDGRTLLCGNRIVKE